MTNPYQKRVRKGKNHSSPAPSKREHLQGDKVQWALLVCSYMRKEVAGQKNWSKEDIQNNYLALIALFEKCCKLAGEKLNVPFREVEFNIVKRMRFVPDRYTLAQKMLDCACVQPEYRKDTDFATLVFSNANYRYSYKEFEKALLQI